MRDALKIAEDSLAQRGLKKTLYVASVTLENTSLLGAHAYWFVKRSHPIPARNPRNREVGIKVKMDGTATILRQRTGHSLS